VLNALETSLDAESFDLVWSLESGEHMPDKSVWLREVARLLRPGGTFVCATWCSREEDGEPLTTAETRLLTRICKNYSLPEFVPLSAYGGFATKARLDDFHATNESWSEDIAPFWPAVIRSALRPLTVLRLLVSFNWTTIKGASS
jgi:tocopherol O-methyltransferase